MNPFKHTVLMAALFVVPLMAFAQMNSDPSATTSSPPSTQQPPPPPPAKMEKGMMMDMSPEKRAKMADFHEQMAKCLRSSKPMAECHKMMMENCPMKGKEGSCPMHDKGGHHGH